jgi:hypothetical protein
MLDWFVKLFRDEAQHSLYVPIPASHVRHTDGSAPDGEPLVAGNHYFRLWLVEMFLKNDRNWFSDWYPAVHSALTFQFGASPQTLTNIVNQTDLKDLNSSHLERFLTMNRELTGLLPFNDGTVRVDAGLLALQGNNNVKNLIKFLGDFGSLLALPQLSAAVKVAGPLADAVGALVGATNGQLMLGLNQTFSEQGGGTESVLRSGYFAALDDQAGQFDREKFWVDGDRLQYGAAIDASARVERINYLLFRIERRDDRKDWDQLSSIHEPYLNVIKALQTGSVDQAQVHLRTAIAAALNAPELTRNVDRRRVVEQLKARFEQDKKDLGAGFAKRVDTSLQSLMAEAMPAKAAAAKRVMTEKEAFAGLN